MASSALGVKLWESAFFLFGSFLAATMAKGLRLSEEKGKKEEAPFAENNQEFRFCVNPPLLGDELTRFMPPAEAGSSRESIFAEQICAVLAAQDLRRGEEKGSWKEMLWITLGFI